MSAYHKNILRNIYKAAKHHESLNRGLANNLTRAPNLREKNLGAAEAYAYIIQFIESDDTIGQIDYDKVHSKVTDLPLRLR